MTLGLLLTISKIMHDIKGLLDQNIPRYLLGSRGVSASTARRGTKASSNRWGRVIRIWQKVISIALIIVGIYLISWEHENKA